MAKAKELLIDAKTTLGQGGEPNARSGIEMCARAAEVFIERENPHQLGLAYSIMATAYAGKLGDYPKSIEFHEKAGTAFCKVEEYIKGADEFKVAMTMCTAKLEPPDYRKSVSLRGACGEALMNAGEFDEAAEVFESAVRTSAAHVEGGYPERVRWGERQGDALTLSGRPREAVYAYERGAGTAMNELDDDEKFDHLTAKAVAAQQAANRTIQQKKK